MRRSVDNSVVILISCCLQAALLTKVRGLILVLISLDIWHQEQGPQKKA